MPLPLLFIGIAAASGMFGIGGTVKAGFDAKNAKQINKSANELVQESTDYLNAQRLACGNSLTQLGAEKMTVLNGTISDFLNVFTQIKNVDFKETEGLDELHRLHIDEQEFVELRSMAHFAGSVAGGAVAGTAGGALAAFGAYGAARRIKQRQVTQPSLRFYLHEMLVKKSVYASNAISDSVFDAHTLSTNILYADFHVANLRGVPNPTNRKLEFPYVKIMNKCLNSDVTTY